jgi:hypothetical protein
VSPLVRIVTAAVFCGLMLTGCVANGPRTAEEATTEFVVASLTGDQRSAELSSGQGLSVQQLSRVRRDITGSDAIRSVGSVELREYLRTDTAVGFEIVSIECTPAVSDESLNQQGFALLAGRPDDRWQVMLSPDYP